MEPILVVVALVLIATLAMRTSQPKAQPPQIIYVRADLPELKEKQATGCIPFVVLGLVLVAIVWLF